METTKASIVIYSAYKLYACRRPKVTIHIMKLYTQLYICRAIKMKLRMCPEHEFATCVNIDTLFARFRQI